LGRRVSVQELMAQIERDVIFFDTSGGGVTVSGGEPLAQPDFVERLLGECKAREIHTALDTSCHGPWETLERIGRHVDLFLCDLKLMDPAAHRRFTGVSNELVLENLRRLTASGRRVIIRMPVIPGVNDGEENLAATGEFVGSLGELAGGSVEAPVRVDILPYNEAIRGKRSRLAGDYALAEFEAPSPERMRRIASKLESFGLRVKIG
jgi:pyruvate formate lyase activating enzyme